LSRWCTEWCKQWQNIEGRDGAPPRFDVKVQIGKAGVYSWKEGQLRSDPSSVNTIYANPTLF